MVAFSSPSSSASSGATGRGRGSNLIPMVGALVVIVLLIAGAYFLWQKRTQQVSSGDYQAVFLSNGQVYFGKVVKSGDEVTLSDVYYLVVQRPVQTQTPETSPSGTNYQLMRLGKSEIHGPMNEMRINKEHVLFTEGLRQDSQVIQAIQKDKEQAQQGK